MKRSFELKSVPDGAEMCSEWRLLSEHEVTQGEATIFYQQLHPENFSRVNLHLSGYAAIGKNDWLQNASVFAWEACDCVVLLCILRSLSTSFTDTA